MLHLLSPAVEGALFFFVSLSRIRTAQMVRVRETRRLDRGQFFEDSVSG
jgi:hypothetical protein